MGKSYKDFILWQKSMNLVELTYMLTSKLPPKEMYGLSSQLRRCAVSIPSNIAEGSKREGKKDYSHFLRMAYGSSAELETQLLLVERLYKIDAQICMTLVEEIQKMLSVSIKKLSS
jgi:four helix bundle protein